MSHLTDGTHFTMRSLDKSRPTAAELSTLGDLNPWILSELKAYGHVRWPPGVILFDTPIYNIHYHGGRWVGCGRHYSRYGSSSEYDYRVIFEKDFTTRLVFTGPQEESAILIRGCRGWICENITLEHDNDGVVVDVYSDLGRPSNHFSFRSVSFMGGTGIRFGGIGDPNNAADVCFHDVAFPYCTVKGFETNNIQNVNYWFYGLYVEQTPLGLHCIEGGNLAVYGCQTWTTVLLKVDRGGSNGGSYSLHDIKMDSNSSETQKTLVDASDMTSDSRFHISQANITKHSENNLAFPILIEPNDPVARAGTSWHLTPDMYRGPFGASWVPTTLS